jgi:hypothetical protein
VPILRLHLHIELLSRLEDALPGFIPFFRRDILDLIKARSSSAPRRARQEKFLHILGIYL